MFWIFMLMVWAYQPTCTVTPLNYQMHTTDTLQHQQESTDYLLQGQPVVLQGE